MELKNCRKCGMIFSTDEGDVLCKSCGADEDELFKQVRDYLYEHPGTNIYELSKRFNLSMKRIERYVNNGRLDITGL